MLNVLNGLVFLFCVVSAMQQHELPRVGFGTAGLGSRTVATICDAVLAGYHLIDTAQALEWYREDLVGEALQRCRPAQDITIVTKIHPRSFE